MSSTCFEVEGSFSGKRLYLQLWCARFYTHWYKQSTLLPTRMLMSVHEKRTIS